MRNSFGTRVSLLIVTVLGSQYLPGQTSYPIQGQPQGGDRRGSYYYDDPEAQKAYDEGRGIPRLYPDPKLYLHNMTLLAHVPRGGGDMMTIGGNRYLVGGGVIIDVTNPKQPVIVNERVPGGEVAYNKALGKWILMQSNSCCGVNQEIVRGVFEGKKHPGTSNPTGRRVGVTFLDVTDPRYVAEISHFSTGPGSSGTHGDGNYYDGGRYAYLASRLPGTRGQLPYHTIDHILQIIDVSDINIPKEVSRWWVPGQMKTEESAFLKWPEAEDLLKPLPKTWTPDLQFRYTQFHGPCFVPQRVEDGGNRGYCAFSALGMRILDLSDIRQPKEVGAVDIAPPFDSGIPVHTVYPMPQRKLAFLNGENTRWDCQEGVTIPWVVDMRAEKYPMTIAAFPIPKPPANAPYNDFCLRGGRFGTHTAQEFKAPGEPRVDLMGYSWFEAGWRLYDVSNPFRPEEVAWIVPPAGERRGTEGALIEWDRKLIHVFTDTGVYIVSTPVLGEPVVGPLKPERWSFESVNVGAP